MSPTSRTLARLKKLGYDADVVERWIPRARVRKDVAGCIDVLAYHPELGIVGIQATTATNHAHRRVKAMQEPRLRRWLQARGQFQIWSWSKHGRFWTCRTESIQLGDLA